MADQTKADVRKAREGNTDAIERARQAVARDPARAIGKLGQGAEAIDVLVAAVCSATPDPLTRVVKREAILAELADLRRNLEGDNPTAIERLLTEQCAISWLVSRHAETIRAAALANGTLHTKLDEMAERAERRHLRAVATLARVRALPPPRLYVDARQVHFATPVICDKSESAAIVEGGNTIATTKGVKTCA